MRLLVCLFLFLLNINCSFAANEINKKNILEVYENAGNIYYNENSSHIVQVTHSGKDSHPVISPDQTMIAFIRIGQKVIPNECADLSDTGSKYGNQIWLYKIGSKKEYLLVDNNFACDKPEEEIADPSNLRFSPDSKTLYFITSAWVTSGALHVVNVDGSNQHYLIPGSSVEIVPRGEYKGYLIVQQHRYFVGGGSYDCLWLYSPRGQEEGPLGDEISSTQKEFLEYEG